MVVQCRNDEWDEALNVVVPPAVERGWFDNLTGGISVEPIDRFTRGRYMSYEKRILLSDFHTATLNANIETLLHEIGHFLHYTKVLPDPEQFELYEWELEFPDMWDDDVTNQDTEYVATMFARYHQTGKQPWDPERYDRLGGPELRSPLLAENEEVQLWE